MDSESFAPARTGKGRTSFLPRRMNGSPIIQKLAGSGESLVTGYVQLEPYGGLTGEEWMESEPKVSTFKDVRPLRDQEEVGAKIQALVREQGITASAAADIVLKGDE